MVFTSLASVILLPNKVVGRNIIERGVGKQITKAFSGGDTGTNVGGRNIQQSRRSDENQSTGNLLETLGAANPPSRRTRPLIPAAGHRGLSSARGPGGPQ